MRQLLVRNVHPRVVAALKTRAASHRRSAEAEHREILEDVLLGSRAEDFKTWLRALPEVPALTPTRSRDRGRQTVL
jgi:plasmid stability protein